MSLFPLQLNDDLTPKVKSLTIFFLPFELTYVSLRLSSKSLTSFESIVTLSSLYLASNSIM